MTITREMIIRKLAEKTNYYQRDIRLLMSAFDDVIEEYYTEVDDDKDISIQLVRGIKVTGKVMPERIRKNPKTGKNVVCTPLVKPQAKFSENFREVIQTAYENRKSEGA